MEFSRLATRSKRRVKTTHKAIRNLLIFFFLLLPAVYLLGTRVQALVTAPPLDLPPGEDALTAASSTPRPATPASAPAPVPTPPAPKPASPAPAPAKPNLAPLKQALLRLLGDNAANYGVFVVDIKSGAATGINETARFPAASTVKLPLAMYVLEQAHQGKVSLDEKIAYSDDDYEDGTGVLQGTEAGTEFAIGDLVKLAITESDNIAANMLLRYFGRDAVAAYTRSLGGDPVPYDGDNLMTPKDMAFYLRRLMQPKYISQETRDLLLDYLSHTEFNDRLPSGLPATVRIAHKIGTLPGVVNDIGIVFAPQRAYIISVMSQNVDEDEATQVIGQISSTVYQFEVRQTGR